MANIPYLPQALNPALIDKLLAEARFISPSAVAEQLKNTPQTLQDPAREKLKNDKTVCCRYGG